MHRSLVDCISSVSKYWFRVGVLVVGQGKTQIAIARLSRFVNMIGQDPLIHPRLLFLWDVSTWLDSGPYDQAPQFCLTVLSSSRYFREQGLLRSFLMFPVVDGVYVATFSTLLVQLFSRPFVAGWKSDFSMCFFNSVLSNFLPRQRARCPLQVNSRYHPPRIYITENGCPDHGDTMYAGTSLNTLLSKAQVVASSISRLQLFRLGRSVKYVLMGRTVPTRLHRPQLHLKCSLTGEDGLW